MREPTDPELSELRGRVLALERQLVAKRASSRRQLVGVAAAVCVGMVLWSTEAWSQLVSFSAGQPALASEINGNFAQLRGWLEQKVGVVGSANVDVGGTLDVAGATTLSGATTVSGAASPRRGLRVNGPLYNDFPDSTYDVWIQGGSADSGATRNLAVLGTDNDSGDTLYLNYGGEYGGGTVVQSSLSVSGNASVTGTLGIGYTRQVCSNISSGASCTCPAGMRLLGGGAYCYNDNEHLNTSYPASTTSWQAWCEQSNGTNVNVQVVILCARI